MKTQKIKRYRLGVSRNFPITHPRKGEPTFFIEKIFKSFDKIIDCKFCDFSKLCTGNCIKEAMNFNPKVHTCRANYDLWAKRITEVQAGRAVIELFYWSGKPYHKDENGIGQVVFATLDNNSGCGVQKLKLFNRADKSVNELSCTAFIDKIHVSNATELLARNDGFLLQDFKDWFKGYDLSEPMAIIHFTKFRYQNELSTNCF